MSGNLLSRLLVASASLALASCGGGDGTFVAPIPPPPTMPPPPSPPPPPPPPPVTVSEAIFPNVSTNTDFATLGLGAASAGTSASSLVRDGFSVRFDAASNAYIIDLPYAAAVGGASDLVDVGNLYVAKASAYQLAYTTVGAITSGYYTTSFAYFAFGSATPASGIPVSGTATYDAQVVGYTLDSYYKAKQTGGSNVVGSISGAATLQFDFGAGTLAGHFDPILTYNDETTAPASSNTISLGSYNFVNTVYGAGETNFSGQLSVSGTSSLGAFDGQFTGPVAQELMARWTAPYLNPVSKQWSDMFGVWVGKKN